MPSWVVIICLSGCDRESKKEPDQQSAAESEAAAQTDPDVLPYLNIQEQAGQSGTCHFVKIKIVSIWNIQTLIRLIPWLNRWIEKKQATVIQDQVGFKQDMSLQQAVAMPM